MSVAQSPTPPDRTSGFLYTCRLAPDGAFAFDAPVAEMERLLEIAPAEVDRMFATGHFPMLPGERSELLESIRASAEQLTPWARDLRVVGPRTGREVWIRSHGVPHREPDGAVVWSGLVIEITDLKAAENRLRETVEQLARSEARMRAALDGARMLGWDLDLVENRWETTVDLSDFYGLPRGADYAVPAIALDAVHPDDVPTVLEARRRAIELGEPMRYEFRGRVPATDGLPRAGFPLADKFFATRAGKPYDWSP